MIRRTVAVTVRVVVEASNEGQFARALDLLRAEGPPISASSFGCVGNYSIDRIVQSHAVVVEQEKKRGKR